MDNVVVYGPGGASPVNVGSWLQADPGPDFGARDLRRALYSEHPYAEGGRLGVEYTGLRRMSFPLMVRAALGASLTEIESFLHGVARPGGYVDVQPGGTPSAQAVRFDIVAGRWEPDYQIRENDIALRRGMLRLETQPFGYLPTWITLASAASVGLPGFLNLPTGAGAGSIFGDAPGFAEIAVQPTVPTQFALGTYIVDQVAWSLGARPSFTALWRAPSLAQSSAVSSLGGDAFALGSQVFYTFPPPSYTDFLEIANLTIGEALEPAYRGRFLAIAYVHARPSQANYWTPALDVVHPGNRKRALGSAPRAVDLISPAVGGLGPFTGSPGYGYVNFGEVTIPEAASGVGQPVMLRLWAKPVANVAAGVATPIIGIAALQLLPLDGAAGVQLGIGYPSIAPQPSVGRFVIDPADGPIVAAATGSLASTSPLQDGLLNYTGDLPRVAPSVKRLDLLELQQRIGAHGFAEDRTISLLPGLSVYYRLEEAAGGSVFKPFWPTPSFGPTGFATGASFGQPGGLWEGPENRAFMFGGSANSFAVASGVNVGSVFWLSFVALRASAPAGSHVAMVGVGSGASGAGFDIGYGTSGRIFFDCGNAASIVYGPTVSITPDATWHFIGVNYGPSTRQVAIYYDGSLVASAQTGLNFFQGASGHGLWIGKGRGGANPYAGLIDELTVMSGFNTTPSGAETARLAHVSPTAAAGNRAGYRQSPAFAAVSVRYQPRFQFLKGL